ncbi:MAG: ABC transporter ATP-binding protein [Chloroflexi bacterium]|nr:ABC transporter ATP-binding protein [Chloroflexota bacterium]
MSPRIDTLSEAQKPLSTPALLDVRSLTIAFPHDRGLVPVVDDVSFTIRPGEIVGLVGESGSGKSMTALGIAHLVPPPGRTTHGEVLFETTDLRSLSARQLRSVRGSRIGFIFQDPMTSLNPVLTVGEQLTESMREHLGLPASVAQEHAIELMAACGIPNPGQRIGDYPHQFSGGMRQRLMTAIAISCDPSLILADEPTTALDATIQAQILDLIRGLSQSIHASVLFITHDLGVASELCDRILVMYGGRLVESGTTMTVLDRPLMPYTQALLASVPTWWDRPKSRLPTIEGMPPMPADMPRGCKFAPRCPYRRSVCEQREPELTMRDGVDHLARCWATESDGWLGG